MHIMFSADWHIKLGQKNVPVVWQIRRYNMLYRYMQEIAGGRKVDLHIAGGDIFDRSPTLPEIQLYFDFVLSANVPTIIYDGNHEATKKGETFLDNLIDVTKAANSLVEIVTAPTCIENIDIIPYAHLKTFDPNDFSGNILCTHVRGEIPPYVKPEIDLEKLARWDTVLAGDLHSHSNSQLNIVYPGSPLSTSFHRSEIENGVLIFDSETLDYKFVSINTPQLLRKTVATVEEAIPTDYDLTIYEVECSAVTARTVDTEESHIEKRVISKSSNTGLNLKGKSKTEELAEYLDKVLELPRKQVSDITSLFEETIDGD